MGVGNTIGRSTPSTITSASGVWSLRDHYLSVKSLKWPGSYDPYWDSTTLLIKSDGPSTNATFLDSSTNAATVTRYGDVTQGSTSPYIPSQNWGAYFDGSGDYMTVPYSSLFDLSTGDWTMEAWFCLNAWGCHIISKDTYGSNFDWSIYVASATSIILYTAGTGSNLSATVPTMSLGRWYHVAFVRDSGTNRIYLNGVQYASNTMGISNSSQSYVTIGCGSWNNPNAFVNGYVSNLRLVKGTAAYPAGTTFTPSLSLEAISGTSLLTCRSNRIKDYSSNNLTLTRYGEVGVAPVRSFSAIRPETYGGSAYFDGNGDYLAIPGTSGQFADGQDFTVEGWLYPISRVTSYPCFFSNYSSAFGTGSIYWGAGHSSGDTTKYQIGINGAFPAIQSTTNISYGDWQHLALVRSSGVITLYINGVANGTYSFSGALNGSGNTTYVGVAGDAIANSYINGHIANYRVVKGAAVYTGNFTPPTMPVTAISGTSLLLNFGNAGIYDATRINTLVPFGNAQVSSSVTKYNSGSIYFDGSGDYLRVQNNLNSSNSKLGTSDFTVECWFRLISMGVYPCLYDFRPAGTSTPGPCLMVGYGSAGKLVYFMGTGTAITGSTTITTGAWYHAALCRSSGVTRLYLNGVQEGSSYTDANNYATFNGVFGALSYDPSLTDYQVNGYMEDIRITKAARYTGSSFTVPTKLTS